LKTKEAEEIKQKMRDAALRKEAAKRKERSI
jgi:hypothetical protein